jgi:uncharacterized protein (DUF1800 family)
MMDYTNADCFYHIFSILKTTAIMPITPYTGTWGPTQRLHLLRRTLFGASKADIAAFANSSMTDMVTALLTLPTAAPTPPLVDYTPAATTNTPPVPTRDVPGQSWIDANTIIESANGTARLFSLSGWWLGLMLQQDRNIREKMTLFWHNHIPTDIEGEPIYCYKYNALLRQHCLGNFKTLVREMTLQPAMLKYLSGEFNQRNAPNENYGRELQELFCIGKDLSPSYTEDDVKAAAKVLTGWRIDNTTLNAYYTASRHSTGNKVFSSFYNNTIIAGRGLETDATTAALSWAVEFEDLLNMIFAHPEVARYVVRKIYRFFVYYKIDATVEADVIVPLADLFRSGGYEIKPVMQALLTSQHFYDISTANSCMIKSPLDHNLSFGRIFGLVLPTDLLNRYRSFRYFNDEASKQGQKAGDLPNVAGWPAYYQSPSYHELWISADTLRKKKEFCDKLLTSSIYNMKVDVLAFTATLNNPGDPVLLIEEALSLLHPLPSDAALKTALKAILLSGQTSDSYWTVAWANYVGAPTNTTFVNTVKGRLQTLYQAITNMAEFQLS